MAAEKIARLVEQALLFRSQRAEALAVDFVEYAIHFDTQVVTIGEIHLKAGSGVLLAVGETIEAARCWGPRIRRKGPPAWDPVESIGDEHCCEIGRAAVPQRRGLAHDLEEKKTEEI